MFYDRANRFCIGSMVLQLWAEPLNHANITAVCITALQWRKAAWKHDLNWTVWDWIIPCSPKQTTKRHLRKEDKNLLNPNSYYKAQWSWMFNASLSSPHFWSGHCRPVAVQQPQGNNQLCIFGEIEFSFDIERFIKTTHLQLYRMSQIKNK